MDQVPDVHPTSLFACSAMNTVALVVQAKAITTLSHSAFGDRPHAPKLGVQSSFTGQWREPAGVYVLGNGYRAYNPRLLRFHSPDSLSPFTENAMNAYGYCASDPINHHDPSGHLLAGLFGKVRRPIHHLLGGTAAYGRIPSALTAGRWQSIPRYYPPELTEKSGPRRRMPPAMAPDGFGEQRIHARKERRPGNPVGKIRIAISRTAIAREKVVVAAKETLAPQAPIIISRYPDRALQMQQHWHQRTQYALLQRQVRALRDPYSAARTGRQTQPSG